jgi:hypothetical protein
MGDLSMEIFPMQVASLLDHFSALRDPRQSWEVVYPLLEIQRVVLRGAMAGAQNIGEIRQWAGPKTAFLRGFLPFARHVRSHDTL